MQRTTSPSLCTSAFSCVQVPARPLAFISSLTFFLPFLSLPAFSHLLENSYLFRVKNPPPARLRSHLVLRERPPQTQLPGNKAIPQGCWSGPSSQPSPLLSCDLSCFSQMHHIFLEVRHRVLHFFAPTKILKKKVYVLNK